MSRVLLLGMPLDLLDREQSLARCVELIERGQPAQHAVVNAGKVVMASENSALREAIRGADIVNADGMAVVWAGRLMGYAVPERVSGIDLMEALLGVAQHHQWPVYFLGARQDVLDDFLVAIGTKFPRLVVAGAHNGYYEDASAIAETIGHSGARILFLGMSSPMKEQFVASQRELLGGLLAFGVGGSFDVCAGVTSRAPVWMQRTGLEWFHRLVQEPRRMWKRYLVGNTRFMVLTIRERFTGSNSDEVTKEDIRGK